MIDPMRHALEKLLASESLSVEESHAVILEIMNGQSSEAEIAALLTALRIKGETVEEIAGAAKAMREKAAPIPTQVTGKLDTCGTGGSGLHTFNISTAVAMVAAACGVPVVKHGNRGVTSKSGSSDVLERIGRQSRTDLRTGGAMLRQNRTLLLLRTDLSCGYETCRPGS